MMDEMFVSPKGPFYQSTQLMALGVIPEETKVVMQTLPLASGRT